MTLSGTGPHARGKASAFRGGNPYWTAFLIISLLFALQTAFVPAHAQSGSASATRQVDLHVGQGRIFRFSQPVESVLIADTKIADLQIVSSDMIYVFGLKPGVTNLIAITSDRQIEASMEFRVGVDNSAAVQARDQLQPGSMTELTFFGDRIVATGVVRNMDEAIDVDNVARTYSPPDYPPLNNTRIEGSQQVNIRVRFAEVSRTELLAYGLEWDTTISDGNFSFGMFKRADISDPNLGFSIGTNDVNVEVMLEALKRSGIVKILAEPNLTAVSGQTASFLAGGEVPVPIPQGDNSMSVQYKPFGVSLRFTPTLLSENRIALNVRPEVSSISSSGNVSIEGVTMPSFVVRRADTTVEVASGQTFAIAGLFQRRLTRNLQKFPILGDVPILGSLFHSQRYQREETELVILITPYLVEPVSNDKLATPIDRPAPRPQRTNAAGVGMIVK